MWIRLEETWKNIFILKKSGDILRKKTENATASICVNPVSYTHLNEGEGVSRLVKEKCDFVASIPMKGDIDSLNASVAAGVLAFEIVRQRLQG